MLNVSQTAAIHAKMKLIRNKYFFPRGCLTTLQQMSKLDFNLFLSNLHYFWNNHLLKIYQKTQKCCKNIFKLYASIDIHSTVFNQKCIHKQ